MSCRECYRPHSCTAIGDHAPERESMVRAARTEFRHGAMYQFCKSAMQECRMYTFALGLGFDRLDVCPTLSCDPCKPPSCASRRNPTIRSAGNGPFLEIRRIESVVRRLPTVSRESTLMGYARRANPCKQPKHLSGGRWQRVGTGRVIDRDPSDRRNPDGSLNG